MLGTYTWANDPENKIILLPKKIIVDRCKLSNKTFFIGFILSIYRTHEIQKTRKYYL